MDSSRQRIGPSPVRDLSSRNPGSQGTPRRRRPPGWTAVRQRRRVAAGSGAHCSMPLEARLWQGKRSPSASCTLQEADGAASRPTSTIAGELSEASTSAPWASKARVRKPVPAPTSVTRSPGSNGAKAASASAKRRCGEAWAW